MNNFFLVRTLLMLLLISTIYSPTQANTNHEFNEQEIIQRLKTMKSGTVKSRYTSVVRGYLKRYLQHKRGSSETILGRSIKYFPMFETYLKEHNLPDELKYLSVVESALRPGAVSRSGAVGLWQFMPATAKDVGLKIDSYIDERKDPQKSTKAAMKYLRMQYNRFGSWELALAAYNGGSGTVSRAIKRGRSKDFWRIRNYLPKETQNYVPAYIAACYLGKFYDEHELIPDYPSLDEQLTTTVLVNSYLALPKVAKITGIPLEKIKALNPAYKKNFIPSSKKGNNLTLPTRVMSAINAYFEAKQPDSGQKIDEDVLVADLIKIIPSHSDYYEKVIYTAQENETLDSLSKIFNLQSNYIRAWNNIHERNEVETGQELVLYGVIIPEGYIPMNQKEAIVRDVEEFEELPNTPVNSITKEKVLPPNTFEYEDYLYYTVGENENLDQIAKKFADVSVRDIMILNNFRSTQIPKAGREIKVKKM